MTEATDEKIAADLRRHPAYAHVCPCGFFKLTNDRERPTKCCQVCAGCNQRIKLANLEGHAKTCVAYGQVTGKIPVDNTWWLEDEQLRRRSFGPPHIFRLNEGKLRRRRGQG